MKDLFELFTLKNGLNINILCLLYNSKEINSDLTFNELINQNNIYNNKIYISVNEKNMNENELKNITCPKCGEKCIEKNNELSVFECLNKHDIKTEMNILRTNLDIFKSDVKEIFRIYNEVIDNVEKYYQNNYDILYNNSKTKNEDNKLNYKNIIKYTNEIINNKYITLDNIINIYNKINSNITIIYKIDENMEEINYLGLILLKKIKIIAKLFLMIKYMN